jgi:hypothetical protein
MKDRMEKAVDVDLRNALDSLCYSGSPESGRFMLYYGAWCEISIPGASSCEKVSHTIFFPSQDGNQL